MQLAADNLKTVLDNCARQCSLETYHMLQRLQNCVQNAGNLYKVKLNTNRYGAWCCDGVQQVPHWLDSA